jgi:hypothetical protein
MGMDCTIISHCSNLLPYNVEKGKRKTMELRILAR